MKRLNSVLPFALIVAVSTPVWAQRGAPKDSGRKTTIPAEARPPKGMCRVWIAGVPANQQPAATDCPSAVKNLPPNARILFGDDYTDTSKTKATEKSKLPPNIKGFTEVKQPPKRPPEDR